MKKTALCLITSALTLTLGIVAQAASTEVMKGTPVIDGKKDAIYSQTISIPLMADSLVYSTSSDEPESDARGTSYLMYDNDYFYVFGEVTDDDVIKNEDATGPEENPWDQDAFENWIDLGDGVFKATVSPFVDYAFGTGDIDPSTFKWACIKGDKGYTIELAIPASLGQGDVISYVLQLNDYGKDGYIRCYGAQQGGVVEYTLGGAVK